MPRFGDPEVFDDINSATPAPFLTVSDILNAHAQFGRVDWHMTKKAMGPNWPEEWERMGPGEAIFEPDEEKR